MMPLLNPGDRFPSVTINPRRETDVFHDGEQAVQERAGVRAEAAKLGAMMVRSHLDDGFAGFLQAQPFVVVASTTRSGQVWASILTGFPGFAVATDPAHVVLRALIADHDPLSEALAGGSPQIGLLVIEPNTRGRIRINGIGQRSEKGLELEITEVFGNCPKYIARRVPTTLDADIPDEFAHAGTRLDAEQISLVSEADTFFIASRHPGRGNDASHRGGRPGFVKVTHDGRSLTFPDYHGNNMFQTLGNLTANPAAGLLFVDWASGRTLQISGRATVVWDEERLAAWPGAERLVDVVAERVVDRAHGSALHWKFLEPHRLNPPPPANASG
jgi:predicted pyridoxine 5'-phosphate oxidase superfamily flavin-nucleotide-binding protein